MKVSEDEKWTIVITKLVTKRWFDSRQKCDHTIQQGALRLWLKDMQFESAVLASQRHWQETRSRSPVAFGQQLSIWQRGEGRRLVEAFFFERL